MNNGQIQNLTDQDRLAESYYAYLSDAVRSIEAAIGGLMERDALQSYPDSLFTIAHRLKGNASLYGYPELGEHAKHSAKLLKAIPEEQDHTAILASLETLTAKIHEICQNSGKSESEAIGFEPTLVAQISEDTFRSQDEPFDMGRKSILIVYEDPWLRQFLASLLEDQFNVFLSGTPGQALSTLEAIDPDLTIVQSDLGEHSGIDFIQTLKNSNEYRHLPIFLTANPDQYDVIARSFELGVVGFTDKPDDILDIVSRVNSYLDTPTYRVLVVDDDPAVQLILSDSLKSHGFNVDTVSDGIDALSYLSVSTPDLIILDKYMPRLGGDTVLYEIQNKINLKSIPVLVLTAMVNSGEAQSWLGKGASDFIAKPFDTEEVALRVKRHLAGKDSRPC